MPKRPRLQYKTQISDNRSGARDIESNATRYRLRSLRKKLPKDNLEDLRRTVEVQAQTIADLQNQLDNEKRLTQKYKQYKDLFLQQRLRMRSHQDSDYVCVATGCGQTFSRADRVRYHIRNTQDGDHQRLAQYLEQRECPSCLISTGHFFRHLFSCSREQYRLALGEFYGVEISDDAVIPPPAIFEAQSIERVRTLEDLPNVDTSDETIDFHPRSLDAEPNLPDISPGELSLPEFAEYNMFRYGATSHLKLLTLTFLSDEILIDVIRRYSFVRFQGIKGDIEEKLERMFNANPDASDAIPNAGELNDDSYGMLVLRAYIPALQKIMAALFPGSTMNSEYHPFEPSETDIEYWGYSSAKTLYMEWFDKRMRSCASDVGLAFYEGLKLLDSQDLRSIDTCRTAGSDFSGSSAHNLTEFGNNEDSSMSSVTSDGEDGVEPSDDEDNEFDDNVIFDTVTINGRTYSMPEGSQWINFYPDDAIEAGRHRLLNRIWSDSMDGRLFLAPISLERATAFDVGCGSGAWAFDIVDTYKDCVVDGCDISCIIPNEQPPRCFLYLDNCNLPLLFRRKYNFIHVRCMGSCIDDWPFFIQQCFQALEPAGYLEVKDVQFDPQSYHKPLTESSVFHNWSQSMIEIASSRYRRDLLAITKVKDMMESQGFVGITEVTDTWPLHAQDGNSKDFANLVRANFEDEIQGLSLGILADAMGSDQVELYLLGLREEINAGDPQIYWQAMTIYGQKPEEY
ncbi:Transmembrane protein 8A [Talaromyces islandicus]|uniref:Transmembrane protein 8A n=1 Tax=Talaromyces islandicus TaxID=28573 RepID=A0A0U1M683_TALIS|nr:Transmembrane protein 8A [Talaromyces islandicus]